MVRMAHTQKPCAPGARGLDLKRGYSSVDWVATSCFAFAMKSARGMEP